MADFHQFLMIFFKECIDIEPTYIMGKWEECGGGVSGDNSGDSWGDKICIVRNYNELLLVI